MTTLKIYKVNGFTWTISKQGKFMYIKGEKRIPMKTFKEEISAQDLINLA
jgi:hypothetical protein